MKSIALVIEFKPFELNFDEVCAQVKASVEEYNKFTTTEVVGHSVSADGYGNAKAYIYFGVEKVRYSCISAMVREFDYYVTTHDCKAEVEIIELPKL